MKKIKLVIQSFSLSASLLLATSIVAVCISSFAWSQQGLEDSADRQPAQVEQDREVLEKAKSRNYKGGGEEGELRVQAQLPKPQRKIAPVIDKKELEKESQEHD